MPRKACYEAQIDFNYLDIDDLSRYEVIADQLHIASAAYRVLVVDSELPPSAERDLTALAGTIPVIRWTDNTAEGLQALRAILPPSPFNNANAPGLRVRTVRKAGLVWTIVFNEGATPVTCTLDIPNAVLCNPNTNDIEPFQGELSLDGHTVRLLITEDT